MKPQTITIGRGDDNVVVIPKSNVSQNHARLTIDGDKLIIEDLGSTNGTAVGTMERKIVKAEVTVDDVLYFGSTRIAVKAILRIASEASRPVQTVTPPQKIARSTPANQSPVIGYLNGFVNLARQRVGDLWLVLSGVALILFAIGLLVPFNRAPAKKPSDAPSSGNASDANNQQSASEDERIALERPLAIEADDLDKPVSASDGPDSPILLSLEERIHRSIYIVYADNTKDRNPMQLAIAFAIDEKHAVTTASIVHLLDQYRGTTFDHIALYRPWDKTSVDIKRMVVHPRWLEAEKKHVEAEKKLKALEESRDPPPAPESLGEIKAKTESLFNYVMDLIDEKTHHDLGLIESSQPFQTWLELTDSADKPRVSQELELIGYSLDPEDFFLDFEQQAILARRPCRLAEAIAQNGSGHRLWVNAEPESEPVLRYGSPILGADGKVAGIFSRVTPPELLREAKLPPDEYRFEAASTEQLSKLREILK